MSESASSNMFKGQNTFLKKHCYTEDPHFRGKMSNLKENLQSTV